MDDIAAKIAALHDELRSLGREADSVYRSRSGAEAGAALIARALRISASVNLAALEERYAAEGRFHAERELDRDAIRTSIGDAGLDEIAKLGGAVNGLYRIARRLPGWAEAERADSEQADVAEG